LVDRVVGGIALQRPGWHSFGGSSSKSSPELLARRRANVERYSKRSRRRSAIRVVEGDAADYSIDQADSLLLLYFPFKGPVMAKVLARMEESLRAGRRGRRTLSMSCRRFASANYEECSAMIGRSPKFRRSLFPLVLGNADRRVREHVGGKGRAVARHRPRRRALSPKTR